MANVVELKTRRPTGKPSWPLILLAGCEKAGKSWAAAAFSASELVDRTFWLEVGEGSADMYGAMPGARYEIIEHDGTFANLGLMTRAACEQPREGRPHALVIDSITEVWDLLADEQQVIANERAARKGRGGNRDASITMDQWNAAKKRWRRLLEVLRTHDGPVILIARLEQVAVVGSDGKPTTDKTWKIRAEKNLPFEVDVVVEMPRPRETYLTGVRSMHLQVPPGGHLPYPDFTVERLLTDMGFDADTETQPRAYIAPNADAYAKAVTGGDHEQLRAQAYSGRSATRSAPTAPASDQWSMSPGREVEVPDPADGADPWVPGAEVS